MGADLRPGGHRRYGCRLARGRARARSRSSELGVRAVGPQAGEARADDRALARQAVEQRSTSSTEGRPAREERRTSRPGRARRGRARRRRSRTSRRAAPIAVRRPCAGRSSAMNASSGGSRFARADERDVGRRRRRPTSISIRSGIPHWLPDGEVSGVFRSPCASSQTTASRSWRAASASTAPTWAQQQPPSTSGRVGELGGERERSARRACPRSTTAASGYGSCEPRPPRHRLAARRPRRAARARARRANVRPQAWHS